MSPGFFFTFRRQHPSVQLVVRQDREAELIELLGAGALDAALLMPPGRLPPGLMVTHRFRVLALYGPRRRMRRLVIRPKFVRELAVVVRKNRVQPEPLASFVKGILF